MGRMIYFMYTGNIRVTEVTVCQLLPAATMFQVPYVVDACCAFLERQLDPTNAIGISSFAEQHGCESLKQKANQFIERNFTQVRRGGRLVWERYDTSEKHWMKIGHYIKCCKIKYKSKNELYSFSMR